MSCICWRVGNFLFECWPRSPPPPPPPPPLLQPRIAWSWSAVFFITLILDPQTFAGARLRFIISNRNLKEKYTPPENWPLGLHLRGHGQLQFVKSCSSFSFSGLGPSCKALYVSFFFKSAIYRWTKVRKVAQSLTFGSSQENFIVS